MRKTNKQTNNNNNNNKTEKKKKQQSSGQRLAINPWLHSKHASEWQPRLGRRSHRLENSPHHPYCYWSCRARIDGHLPALKAGACVLPLGQRRRGGRKLCSWPVGRGCQRRLCDPTRTISPQSLREESVRAINLFFLLLLHFFIFFPEKKERKKAIVSSRNILGRERGCTDKSLRRKLATETQ